MKEIEKKFLIKENNNEYFNNKFIKTFGTLNELKEKALREGKRIIQGYLITNSNFEVRLSKRGDEFFMTLKNTHLVIREEFDNHITKEEFEKLWNKTIGRRIKKIRIKIPYKDYNAEFDFYLDRDLIIMEIEVKSIKDYNNLPLFGLDVTKNEKYKNKNLAR